MSVSAIDQISQGSLPPSIAAGGALPGGAGATLPPAVAQDPRVQAAQAQAAKADAEQADIAKRKEAEMAPINADIEQKNKDLGAMAAKGPDQQALPENNAKHMDPKQLSDAFSTFMTLGALAGLLSRTPMTAALNNMTAAINGVQAGDQAQYDQSYKEFQQNYQKAVDQNKAKLEEYNRVFANNKMTLDEKIREAGLVANKYGDELVRAEARNNNYKGIQSAIDASVKSQESAQQHKDTLDMEHQRLSAEWARIGQEKQNHQDSLAHQDAELKETMRYHDAEIAKMQAAGGKGMSPTMKHSVQMDIQELNQSLEKIGTLKTKKGSPFFNADKPGFWSSLTGKAATPEEMQVYDVYANRMAVAIASIQSMGRGQVSDSKVREARKLVPTLGDKPETIKAKLAQIRAITGMAQKEMNQEGSPAAGSSFSTEAEAEAAAKAGTLKPGARVTIGGQTGTWN